MFGPRFEIPNTVGDESFTVVMRGTKPGDAEALSELLGDYTAQQFILMSGTPTIKDEEEWLERIRTDQFSTTWLIDVVQGNKEEFVGTTGLHHDHANFLSSGILLANKAWWGKGIATLTHQFRTWFAFRELGAYAIASSYAADNEASGKALRKVGYVDRGRLWRWRLTAGSFRDEVELVCYNPATISLLWPDGGMPAVVKKGLPKTIKALEYVDNIIEPR